MSLNGNHKIYAFSEFRLEAEAERLTRDDVEIRLAKRPFQILLFLLENRERTVSREELLSKFWDGADVYDDALRKTVGTIRHALNDTDKPSRLIETRYGRGFRFIGELSVSTVSPWEFPQSSSTPNQPNLKTTPPRQNSRPRYVLMTMLTTSAILFAMLSFFAFRPRDHGAATNQLATVAKQHSIAVLPLKNLTGDANYDYLSDGITESIITELSRLSELRVISRSSTFTFKGKESTPAEIGRQLGVDSFLEGSLQKKADSLSVSVRLISTKDGQILWTSQNFDRQISVAFELQSVISCNVANQLDAELCGVIAQHPRRSTTNAEAYQNFLQGRYEWNKRTGEGIKKSIEFYEQAIALDANYAAAYAGLAESYLQGIWHVPFAPKDVLPKAKTASFKALELDDTSAEAHTALANVYELEWNWPEAEREIKRAIELNPRYARAYHVQAFCLSIMGRHDEAIRAIERARDLDPLNLVINTDKAQIFFNASRTEEAFQQWEKTLELDPNFALTYEHKSFAYQILGNESAAIEENVKAMQLSGRSAEEIEEYRHEAAKGGLKEIYRTEARKLAAKEARGESISLVYLAWYYASLGQKDDAFKYLEKAYRERSAEIVLLPAPQFSSLRSDPRYDDLLRRTGLLG